MWVVDCSAFMPLALGDEDAGPIEELLYRAVDGHVRIIVPSLFWYEVTNVLRTATMRNRIRADQAEGALYRLSELPISTDMDLSASILFRIGRFASEHGLTAYDAAYVELAERHAANLLTADKELQALSATYPWIRPDLTACA